jgi:8-oxo-dGTP pyrophosphatase MutT (NUDIX family)
MSQFKDGTETIPDQRELVKTLPVREGAYGVLVKDNQVLMCHTTSGKRIIINFPGGAIDAGEDPEQALLREFEEESGGKVRVLRHLASSDGLYVNPDYPKNRLLCHYFLVAEVAPLHLRGNNADVERLEWFSLSALPFERMLDVDAKFCRTLRSLLEEKL